MWPGCSDGRIIFESLDSAFGLFGFWLISELRTWILIYEDRKFATHTFSDTDAAGKIYNFRESKHNFHQRNREELRRRHDFFVESTWK